ARAASRTCTAATRATRRWRACGRRSRDCPRATRRSSGAAGATPHGRRPPRGALPAGDAPLVGRGWDDAAWQAPPEAAALDAVAPDRPVLLHRHDFHALWVNT